ncbi:MAG: hydroxyacid dehydrogenase [Pseudolabrys sp.]|nr:hydroxyacid dehydrogenase [Pseudolabrys sp.]MDP2296372.1 hydroxyacid dehydrogenase [Pseudolabrys sp.]
MSKPKAALFYNYPSAIEGDVFGQGRRERIAALTELYPHAVHAGNFDEHAPRLADLEVIFATWGMMNFSPAQRAQLPKLKAVFYAAGNVKAFAPSLIDNGIILMSAWAINAIPPAEMCLSQILLSLRGYFRTVRQYRESRSFDAKKYWRPGVNSETVGLIGLGYIGSLLRRKLADYPITVIAHDPFLTAERAAALSVTPVSLEELFATSYIVSNHIPDLPNTRNVLDRKLFASMRDGATFINTGRGAQVVEADLIAVLRERPDLTALLDVTAPEPPEANSELWRLPNVIISPHIGGTTGHEVVRLSDCAIEEFESWRAGRPLRYQVTREIFRTMG